MKQPEKARNNPDNYVFFTLAYWYSKKTYKVPLKGKGSNGKSQTVVYNFADCTAKEISVEDELPVPLR